MLESDFYQVRCFCMAFQCKNYSGEMLQSLIWLLYLYYIYIYIVHISHEFHEAPRQNPPAPGEQTRIWQKSHRLLFFKVCFCVSSNVSSLCVSTNIFTHRYLRCFCCPCLLKKKHRYLQQLFKHAKFWVKKAVLHVIFWFFHTRPKTLPQKNNVLTKSTLAGKRAPKNVYHTVHHQF